MNAINVIQQNHGIPDIADVAGCKYKGIINRLIDYVTKVSEMNLKNIKPLNLKKKLRINFPNLTQIEFTENNVKNCKNELTRLKEEARQGVRIVSNKVSKTGMMTYPMLRAALLVAKSTLKTATISADTLRTLLKLL